MGESPVGENEQGNQIQSQGNGGQRKRKVANHPLAMSGDVPRQDAAIGHPTGKKPEHSEKTEAEVRGPALL